jgi:hypothetical protein
VRHGGERLDGPGRRRELVERVQAGKATLADLTAGGATQLGGPLRPSTTPPVPGRFPATGNWTVPACAASVAGMSDPSLAAYVGIGFRCAR